MPVHLLIPRLTLLGAALVLAPLPAVSGQTSPGIYAEITTPRGVITCRLEPEKAPLTVANFVGLAEGTLGPAPRKPFFDGLTFHRVVPHFVIQGGDPLNTGEGGPGYAFPDEFTPGLGHGAVGVLSMANDGPDTNGSQFFITLAPVERLDFLHAVFGHVVSGLDVLGRIEKGDPLRVRIVRVGEAALAFRADDAAFAELKAKTRPYRFGPEPGSDQHFDDPSKLLPQDVPRARNFNFKLGNVERSTGIRIYARVFAKAGAGDPDVACEQLARSLGLADNGALAVYYADRDRWSLFIGKDLVERFITAQNQGASAAQRLPLGPSEARFFEETRRRAAIYKEQTAAVLPNNLQSPAQFLKVSVDAVIDVLIEELTTDK